MMVDLYTIKGTSAQGTEIVTATCGLYRYQVNTTDDDGKQIPNPESEVQFTKRKFNEHLKEIVKAWAAKGAESTKKQLIADAEIVMDGLTTN